MVNVQKGEGKVVVNDKEQALRAGDAICDAGEVFYWEGEMELYVSCSPAWYKEQYGLVD